MTIVCFYPVGIQPQRVTEEQSTREVKFLSHQQSAFHPKYGFRPVTGVIGTPSGIIHGDGMIRNTQRDGVLPHGFWLIVVQEAIIPAHQQLFHFSAYIKTCGSFNPVTQNWSGCSITTQTRSKHNGEPLTWRIVFLINAVLGIYACNEPRQEHSKQAQSAQSQGKLPYESKCPFYKGPHAVCHAYLTAK